MVGAVIRLVVGWKIRVHARSVDEEGRGRLSFRSELDILLKLTGFIVMLSPLGTKHLALTEGKPIDSMARFFASLRFAQNDKLPYFFMNERVMITNVIKSVSLSILVKIRVGHDVPG
jgi:hypothetical protein